jgi:hypothetical protein
MTGARTISTGLLAVVLAAAASTGAWAAGFDAPPGFAALMLLLFVLLFGVPAMGFGYALAAFLTLRNSLVVVLALALVPTVAAWIMRGLDVVIALAPFQLMMLVLMGPLFVLGWYIGHRDTQRQAARRQAYENGK